MRRRLAAALLRARLLRHPAAGASWEGFVIEQLLGALAAHGVDANPHYQRTSDGNEIDLLLALGGTTIAVEVKLAAGAAPQDLPRLERAADLVSARRARNFLPVHAARHARDDARIRVDERRFPRPSAKRTAAGVRCKPRYGK